MKIQKIEISEDILAKIQMLADEESVPVETMVEALLMGALAEEGIEFSGNDIVPLDEEELDDRDIDDLEDALGGFKH